MAPPLRFVVSASPGAVSGMADLFRRINGWGTAATCTGLKVGSTPVVDVLDVDEEEVERYGIKGALTRGEPPSTEELEELFKATFGHDVDEEEVEKYVKQLVFNNELPNHFTTAIRMHTTT